MLPPPDKPKAISLPKVQEKPKKKTTRKQTKSTRKKRSETALSKDKLAAEGWICDDVERWIPHTRIKKDLFGGWDLLAVRDGVTMAVQVTSRSNVSARVKKIHGLESTPILSTAWRLEVWGWDWRDGKPRLRVEKIS